MNDKIVVVNATENNLRNVNVEIKKNEITVFTGVSGSGKSSLVFDTIANEACRQMNETYDSFTRRFMPKYKRPNADEILNLSPAIVINQKKIGGNSRSTLGTITDINPLLRLLYSRFANPSLGSSNYYSFNDPHGMCEVCEGIGTVITLDPRKALDFDKSLNEGAILLQGMSVGSYYWKMYANSGYFDMDKKIKDYSKEELDHLLYDEATKVEAEVPNSNITINGTYEGLAVRFIRTNVKFDKEVTEKGLKTLEDFSKMEECPKCKGRRFNENVYTSLINGYSLPDLLEMQLSELITCIEKMKNNENEQVITNIIIKAKALCDIGLDYMTLSRITSTLSGGESQRVKMVKYLSSNLVNMLYVFDEPSTGLHPRDVHRLNELLISLKNKGNTVLVVEHDPDVIKIADNIVDMGPLAGSKGGEVVFTGSYKELLNADTLTAKALKNSKEIKENPRTSTEMYESSKSSLHNLKNVSLRVPKGIFTVVTGVAGSGKSTLVNSVFKEEFKDAILIDQNPIHTTSRSNPAMYLGIMDQIRKLFAKENGVTTSEFSHNSKGGCKNCKGRGSIELNLAFMENVEVVCDVCGGSKYDPEILKYLYNGKNIVEVMDLRISEAVEFFKDKKILNALNNALSTGLGYIFLGQSLNTISGGEAQRLKLAKEIDSDASIFILDEPTTGLHLSDIDNVLNIIDTIVSKGNTVIVIEHNIDVIRSADYIIDMGPDGGLSGGKIIFEGLVADIKNCDNSVTAKYI